LDEKTTSIFSEFMLRITKFEELVDRARQFLIGFCQELGTFRRPHLYKKSKVVDQIIGDNQTNRMKAYVEAGCRHRYRDIQNISKLNSSIQELQDHLMEVKVLLDQLECLKEEAIGIAQEVCHRPTQILDTCISNEEGLPLEEEDIVESIHLQDKSISYATLMAVIYNMFRLDYTMQENIINSVNLAATTSEQLESYCLMWNLRPYINDNVMRQSWKLVS